MSEKVLGFYRKDGEQATEVKEIRRDVWVVEQDKIVPVILLKRLKYYCAKNGTWNNKEWVSKEDLLCWAEKQAKVVGLK